MCIAEDGIRDTARAGPTSESSTPARLQLRPRVLDLLHIFSWPVCARTNAWSIELALLH